MAPLLPLPDAVAELVHDGDAVALEGTRELTLTQVHAGVDVEEVRAATGWPLAVAREPGTTEPPTEAELAALRELMDR